MNDAVVVGIDGGGTYTRAIAADLAGRVLGRAQSGPANPSKTPDAEKHLRQVIGEVLHQGGRHPSDVAALVAGIAGLDEPADQAWAAAYTEIPGLTARRVYVNDAVVAHAGALAGEPGIIAISGTGSIVFGVTPDGRQVRNYDFHHYAYGSARHLSFDLVYRILAGQAGPADEPLVTGVLAYWRAADLPALHALGSEGFTTDRFERIRRFGDMAPLVTAAAQEGVPLARLVCDHAAEALVTGIRLVGGCFGDQTIPVALIGGAVRSAYMQQAVQAAFAHYGDHPYRLVEPLLSSTAGAVLMALQAAGIPPDAAVRENLKIAGE